MTISTRASCSRCAEATCSPVHWPSSAASSTSTLSPTSRLQHLSSRRRPVIFHLGPPTHAIQECTRAMSALQCIPQADSTARMTTHSCQGWRCPLTEYVTVLLASTSFVTLCMLRAASLCSSPHPKYRRLGRQERLATRPRAQGPRYSGTQGSRDPGTQGLGHPGALVEVDAQEKNY